jgi:RNA-directed DNA polymerase
MDEYENIISYESLLAAHYRARCCKQHKKEVIDFELNLSKNLWQLHYELEYRKYRVGGYHRFMIYDPKEREIQAISRASALHCCILMQLTVLSKSGCG